MSQAGRLREWESGGKGKADDSSYGKTAENQNCGKKAFILCNSQGIWQVGFNPKTVCMVSQSSCSDCCDAGRGFIFGF